MFRYRAKNTQHQLACLRCILTSTPEVKVVVMMTQHDILTNLCLVSSVDQELSSRGSKSGSSDSRLNSIPLPGLSSPSPNSSSSLRLCLSSPSGEKINNM